MHILSPGYRNTNVAALYASAGGSLLDGSESDGTNLITATGNLDFSGWASLNTTLTANNGLAPDGATTAARVLEDTSNSRHILYNSSHFTITAGGTYTYSVYAKSITRQYFQWFITGSGGIYAYFDLQNGTVTDSGVVNASGGTAVTSTACEAAVNGFYKCTLRGIVDGTSTTPFMAPACSDVATFGAPLDANSPSFTGNASNGVYLWRPKVTT